MGFKKPLVNLLNGKKTECWFCKEQLILKETEFEMKQAGGTASISVTDELFFCPSCHRNYIAKSKSLDLVKKHPGYFVDVSLYDIKPKRKRKSEGITQSKHTNEQLGIAFGQNSGFSVASESDNKNINGEECPSQESYMAQQELLSTKIAYGFSPEVYFSNEYSANHNICPFCCSVLSWRSVNIPTMKTNGDFHRYYSEVVQYCNKCRKAFITQNNIGNILKRIQNAKDTDSSVTIQFKNGTLERSGNSKGYLFNPTLDNSFSIFQPPLYSWYADNKESLSSTSGEMDLNPESFLGKMSYSVNRPENIRRSILKKAVDIHGKRRVADHIAWLISTRKSRADQARAVKVWQGDLNFVTNIIKED